MRDTMLHIRMLLAKYNWYSVSSSRDSKENMEKFSHDSNEHHVKGSLPVVAVVLCVAVTGDGASASGPTTPSA